MVMIPIGSKPPKNNSKQKKDMMVLKIDVPSIMFYDVRPLIDNTFLRGLHKTWHAHWIYPTQDAGSRHSLKVDRDPY